MKVRIVSFMLVFVATSLSKGHVVCHWSFQFKRNRVTGIVEKSPACNYKSMGFSFTGAEEQNGTVVCVTISWTLFSGGFGAIIRNRLATVE